MWLSAVVLEAEQQSEGVDPANQADETVHGDLSILVILIRRVGEAGETRVRPLWVNV